MDFMLGAGVASLSVFGGVVALVEAVLTRGKQAR